MCELNDTVVEAQLRTLHMPPCCPLLIHSILSSPPFTPPPPSRFGSFPSELNDTVVEAQLRTLHIPPLLPVSQWLQRHTDSLGGATQATHAGPNQGDEGSAAPKPHPIFNPFPYANAIIIHCSHHQVRLHPIMLAALHWLSSDPANTIVIMSGSECAVLDEEFGRVKARDMLQQLWTGPISNTAVDMVQVRLDAPPPSGGAVSHARADWATRDMLQHGTWRRGRRRWCGTTTRLTGMLSRSPSPTHSPSLMVGGKSVEVRPVGSMFCRLAFFPSLAANPSQGGKSVEVRLVGGGKLVEVRPLGVSKGAAMERGGKSVEVRPVGVSKGAAMEMVLREIVHQKSLPCPFDFVITVGHLISRDEDIYQLFEPDLPHDNINNMPPGMDGYQQSMDGTMDPMDGNCGVSMDDSVTARSSRLKVESRVGGGGSDGDAAVGSEGRGAPAGAGASGVGGSSSGRSRGSGLGGFRWKGSKKSEKEICLFLLLAVAGQPAWGFSPRDPAMAAAGVAEGAVDGDLVGDAEVAAGAAGWDGALVGALGWALAPLWARSTATWRLI
ncbi:unnamed protein product [Closterium sp. NIES-64]|nr:unnamed protein product [Closterium sp. NIES-64]